MVISESVPALFKNSDTVAEQFCCRLFSAWDVSFEVSLISVRIIEVDCSNWCRTSVTSLETIWLWLCRFASVVVRLSNVLRALFSARVSTFLRSKSVLLLDSELTWWCIHFIETKKKVDGSQVCNYFRLKFHSCFQFLRNLPFHLKKHIFHNA
jgi:hypothetical protein